MLFLAGELTIRGLQHEELVLSVSLAAVVPWCFDKAFAYFSHEVSSEGARGKWHLRGLRGAINEPVHFQFSVSSASVPKMTTLGKVFDVWRY